MNDDAQLRLMARIARMYHERGIKQSEIADELHVSQPRVSRLLKRAAEEGIVRTVVTLPTGTFTSLEEEIESRYGLSECVVVDAGDDEATTENALAAAAATYLETTLTGGDVIGLSSWSATWLAAIERLQPFRTQVASAVVQLFGGIGNPTVQVKATRMIDLLARATGATPEFFPSPAVLGTAAAAAELRNDPSVVRVLSLLPEVTVGLVGIGSLEPSPLLRQSGNISSEADQEELRAAGAVGDVCLRYFDADGVHVNSDFDRRLVGADAEQLRAIPRRLAAAGGKRKHAAIRAALRGGWVNVLITDATTARVLLDEPSSGA
ncbi:sugar-binding transcriptional regulator [Actinomyces ruminicola]|uniref:DNA-binding transcriptional regulator LsrR, DeoR family n=1 Tax=Actinomyces ruminicola TaxID=332524 RepID=A0A1G9ZLA9_9ACTO|nr:sugar-binding transcriptional regulator [Actinomyces ruminicola]SDN21761.1 DNA-binding transcriptional regulator LsrR, DeoR family [Actinomyces ruminicola]